MKEVITSFWSKNLFDLYVAGSIIEKFNVKLPDKSVVIRQCGASSF